MNPWAGEVAVLLLQPMQLRRRARRGGRAGRRRRGAGARAALGPALEPLPLEAPEVDGHRPWSAQGGTGTGAEVCVAELRPAQPDQGDGEEQKERGAAHGVPSVTQPGQGENDAGRGDARTDKERLARPRWL